MAEDTSLDAFVGDGTDEDIEAGEGDGTDDVTEGRPDDGPEPATTTYAWRGDGAACAACGEVVQRRWQQAGDLVCPDCKEWDRG